jgi:Protein of unknown function (DUF2568)
VRQAFHWANLALAFALELCALAALLYWGFSVGGGSVAKAVLGIGAPVCAAVLWGLFAAPRAQVSVPLLELGTKLLVFGSATLALYATGHRVLALVFVFVVVANAASIRLGR